MPEDDTIASSTDTTSVPDSAASVETSGSDPSVGTQTAAYSPNAGTSNGSDSAIAETQPDNGIDTSLKSGINESNPQHTPEQIAEDAKLYKERYASQMRAWQQERAQRQAAEKQAQEFQARLEELTKRFDGVDPKAFEQFKSSQGMKISDPRHPQNPHFRELMRTAHHYDKLLRVVTDENFKQQLSAMREQDLGPEGIKILNDHRADVQREEWERQLDPRGYYRKIVQEETQPLIRNTLQETSNNYHQSQQAVEGVKKWMSDNKEIATNANLQRIQGMMQQGTAFEVAAAMVERDHYRSQLSTAGNAKASADEKQRLLEGNAAGTIARNPNSRSKLDTAKLRQNAKGGRDFIDQLFDADQKGLL